MNVVRPRMRMKMAGRATARPQSIAIVSDRRLHRGCRTCRSRWKDGQRSKRKAVLSEEDTSSRGSLKDGSQTERARTSHVEASRSKFMLAKLAPNAVNNRRPSTESVTAKPPACSSQGEQAWEAKDAKLPDSARSTERFEDKEQRSHQERRSSYRSSTMNAVQVDCLKTSTTLSRSADRDGGKAESRRPSVEGLQLSNATDFERRNSIEVTIGTGAVETNYEASVREASNGELSCTDHEQQKRWQEGEDGQQVSVSFVLPQKDPQIDQGEHRRHKVAATDNTKEFPSEQDLNKRSSSPKAATRICPERSKQERPFDMRSINENFFHAPIKLGPEPISSLQISSFIKPPKQEPSSLELT
ncbi:hypothetical protein GUITHDRAFT_112279 [Guillardia theta CCMP2712]|uniref:Uncharacterized protein n=1 Tax=Guillardia theta (strain CCMP2712) TaxID=905079 RepID=L1IZP5_GUITC|nr:hypothetical protein GUITHDRAFT_112279 [Guillardia theta CCMP2712]EKX41567.1 hypothetical protein GUITHDRAFT_112279 [Guillardia theta CCMP2712]|eukprot:XP_005828547.1 hypothetical protein GUITHDRAFT_112279 [Guillardia theta CCMP2712]